MRRIRIKAYIIDFIILGLAIFIINTSLPDNPRLNESKIEMNEIVSERLDGGMGLRDYTEKYSIVYYQAAHEQQVSYLLYLSFMIIYFVIIPYFWKGRTIGCYLCLVQVERFDSGRLKMWQLFVRYAIVFGLGYIFMSNIMLFFVPEKNYFVTISIVAVFQFVVAIFSAITVLYKSEKRGFHEYISNTELTKIIDVGKKKKRKKKTKEKSVQK